MIECHLETRYTCDEPGCGAESEIVGDDFDDANNVPSMPDIASVAYDRFPAGWTLVPRKGEAWDNLLCPKHAPKAKHARPR